MRRPSRLGVASALVDGIVVAGDVSVAGGRIESVGLAVGEGASGLAIPGIVDWQVNGFGGVHFGSTDSAGLLAASEALARAGIVFAAPTLLSMDLDGYRTALAELEGFRSGATACGLTPAHLEGPFLSAEFGGAHRSSTFCEPDVELLGELLVAGPVAMITVAPELPGMREVIRVARNRGVTVAIGHSDADSARCSEAQELGVQAITHCWNAHRRLTSRDPGPAGWALSSAGVTVGLIADGIHVAPEVLALTFSAAAGRIALTTDAIAPAGTDATSWKDSGWDVSISGGAARLADGTLAGSVATPTSMLRVLEACGVGQAAAVHALGGPQSAALGLSGWSLRPGDEAHVTVLDDTHEVTQAWRGGARVF